MTTIETTVFSLVPPTTLRNHQYPTLGEEFLGLERKPTDSCAPATEDVLLTLRRDLLAIREGILNGEPSDKTLEDVNYTLDHLDNVLAEM